MKLDLKSLRDALGQLAVALEYAESDRSDDDPILGQLFRSAAIQAFEYSYELSFKMLRRFLEEMDGSSDAVKELSFDGIIRRGYEEGLLNAEISVWRDFRKKRGTTSHGYDEAKAQEVYEGIADFLEEAQFLLSELERRQNAA